MTSLIDKYFDELASQRQYVDIYRDGLENEALFGIPWVIGKNIIGLAKFNDSGFFDGFSFFEKTTVTRIRKGGNEQNSIRKLIEAKQYSLPEKIDSPLDNLVDVIDFFSNEIMTISIEEIDPEICFLGILQKRDDRNILLHSLGTSDSLDHSELMLHLNDITKIEVKSLYSKNIEILFEQYLKNLNRERK